MLKYNENFKQYEYNKILLCKNNCLFYNIVNYKNLMFGIYKNTKEKNKYLFRINLENEKDYLETNNNNILLKKHNILILNERKFCISGEHEYFIYDNELNLITQLKINYNIVYFQKHDNGDIICGGEKGEIFIIENIESGEIVFEDLKSHDSEINSIIKFKDNQYLSRDKQNIKLWNLIQENN